MDFEIEQHKQESIRLCEKLIVKIKKNKEDINLIFGGEIKKAYIEANDKALNEARKVLTKINNL